MLKTLNSGDFSAALKEKREQQDRYAGICWQVIGALTSCWMKELGGQKLSIMMFLVNRTLYYRKAAERIYSIQFEKGITDSKGNSVCDGLQMGGQAFRKHLNELIEQDFVDVYCELNEKSHENTARLYEINFKKLLAPYTGSGSKMPFLRATKQEKSSENPPDDPVEGGYENHRGGGVKINPLNSTYKRTTKVVHSGSAPRSGNVVAGQESNGSRMARRKQADTDSPVYEDPATPTEIVAKIQQKATAFRAATVAKAATTQPWLLSQKEMQAIVDSLMSEFYPKESRLVVTGLQYGKLKKELKKHQPKDFSAFMRYVFVNWSMISSQHRNAINRNEEKRVKAEYMSRTPSAWDLAIRLSYFLQCYSNDQASRRSVETQDTRDREVERLKRALTQKEQENKVLKQRGTRRREEPESDEYEVTRQRYTRTRPTKPVSTNEPMSEDDLGPEEAVPWSGYQKPYGGKRNVG